MNETFHGLRHRDVIKLNYQFCPSITTFGPIVESGCDTDSREADLYKAWKTSDVEHIDASSWDGLEHC